MKRLVGSGMLVVVSNLFCACAALPDWVLNPPVSDTELYATGQGRTLQESEQAAIKNLLGQLRTRVSSRFMMAQQSVNDAFKETIEQSVDSRIENFPISQYQILQRHQEGEVIYTQAKTTKVQLAKGISSEVEANLNQIDKTFKTKDTGGSDLEWWVANKQLLFSKSAENARYLDILGLLNTNTSSLEQKAKQHDQRLNETAKNSCLFVNPTSHTKLQQALRKQVISTGLPADNSNCIFKVDISTSNKESKLFGKYTSSLTMKATLLKQGSALTSTEVTQTGQSVSGQDVANTASLTLLVKRLEDPNNTLISTLLAN